MTAQLLGPRDICALIERTYTRSKSFRLSPAPKPFRLFDTKTSSGAQGVDQEPAPASGVRSLCLENSPEYYERKDLESISHLDADSSDI